MGYLLQNGGLGMAGDWIITGGRPLQGRVEVPAAKNSALPLLAAALLCSGPVRLQNVPRLTDVEDCLALLRGVGCTAGWQGAALAVQGQPMRTDLAPEAAGRMRASILFCAPLLARGWSPSPWRAANVCGFSTKGWPKNPAGSLPRSRWCG